MQKKPSEELGDFNKLFNEYKERFTRFANTYVRDISVAEDFTNDSFLYYWENRATIDTQSNPPAYILTTLKHKCLNYLQSVQIRQDVSEKLRLHAEWELQTRITSLEACEPYQLFTEEIQNIVNESLRNLPEKTRKIFLLSRKENYSHKEIAEKVGLSTKSVEFHINKTLKVLRENLKDYLPVLTYLSLFL
ncbi:RNA polymerase sigma-70 factor [Massilibacteroides sp.]|uniref:RNA polymerase sigma-70 factor n=1 Tax=Massilibacteroides sp. TaxID=2034766 RepID=UPI00260F4250|nr:RNA polymerase sigma-70 factor [Massilibacteroides sp.]MDD4515315.1 RNA polymerase sigma-70 factor [Massilibacteroides sp.]